MVVRSLIELGADPHALDLDGGSILISSIYNEDEMMLATLLQVGVDPNRGCAESFETVLDAAEFDYRYEAWMWPDWQRNTDEHSALFDPPYAKDMGTDAYLQHLDTQALVKGRPRPRLPLLLRHYGALRTRDIASRLGAPERGVEWTGSGWYLHVVDEVA